MKGESSLKVTGLITVAAICCFVLFLIFFAGAGILVALMTHWSYILTGFVVIFGGVIFFIYGRVKHKGRESSNV